MSSSTIVTSTRLGLGERKLLELSARRRRQPLATHIRRIIEAALRAEYGAAVVGGVRDVPE